MNKFLLIIIILLLIIYSKYYTKINKATQIIQTDLDKLNFNILSERNPIYIHEKIVDINQIITKSFKHMYTFKYKNELFNDKIKMNLSKYNLFHNNSETDKFIIIMNPINKNKISFKNSLTNTKFITSDENDVKKIDSVKIILKPYNVLIIPYGWLFQCETKITNIYLFDIMNIIISKYNNIVK